MFKARWLTVSLIVCALFASLEASGAEYSWQKLQAEPTPTGDLKWSPRPFEFTPGDEVRYIDFENGDDSNDGLTKGTPWKHHPWDSEATGKAAQASGAITYVFRRGVDYRGNLVADESGEPGNPIRLTCDPDWGEGQARIMASTRLPAQWVRATTMEQPDRLPEPEKVWAIDMAEIGLLNEDGKLYQRHRKHWKDAVQMPYVGLFLVDEDGASHTQHNARTPDWQPGNDNFVLDYWHRMDGAKNLTDEKGLVRKGIWDEEVLQGHPPDYFTGGYIWPQYGHFMGGPMPRLITETTKTKRGTEIPMYNPEEGVIYTGCYGNWAENLRYMIENLPQYLDSAGEFYFDEETGLFFYRPEEGQNPNELRLEYSSIANGVVIEDRSHIEISGLDFRYQTTHGVAIGGNVEDVTIRNCVFQDILQYGVRQSFANWRVHKEPEFADRLRVTDCDFRNIWETSIEMTAARSHDKVLGHIEVMRNRVHNSGVRDKGNVQSAVPAINLKYMVTGKIAGNILSRCFGSGIMVSGSQRGNTSRLACDHPLSRILVHHNKTEDTALGVNDYGGMSLWQGGSIYCYNNNIGNSPGYMPAGITMFGGREMNLSYPLYLDGAYKVFSFNNIVWARSNELQKEKYATRTPGYFMVFGFLNQFVNNTLYRHGDGVGGSSGHRNDVLGNVFSDIEDAFIAHDRSGDPSLVGGGDTGASGRRGVPTLAYANNVFFGEAKAGRLLRPNEPAGYPEGIQADTVEKLAQMMQDFPIRYGQLGRRTEKDPIVGKATPGPVRDVSEVDFRPAEDSAALDSGVKYFVPWSLYGTVGEWNFNENHADPDTVLDYSWYMSKAHYNRSIYEFIPSEDLRINQASLEDYVPSPSEDWVNGAMVFDGGRYGRVPDEFMRKDITLPMVWTDRKGDTRVRNRLPEKHWIVPEPTSGKGRQAKYADDAVLRYPGDERKTLVIQTENMLVEANLRVDEEHKGGTILAKHDGRSGYRLFINQDGAAEFQISSGGTHGSVATARQINDGEWHHVLAEVDRQTGRMTIYLDGKQSDQTRASLAPDASLDNRSDFLVGRADDGSHHLEGAIDFMRVCRGTLEDAQTDIAELYEWQTNGPFLRDFCGNEPVGKRDAGAIEPVR